MNQVVIIKARQLIIVNVNADIGLMRPDGISRCLVRGFLASTSLSRYLLNAIAELRANTMHKIISTSLTQSNLWLVVVTAKKKPIIANGMAKMVWEKVTNERYFFIYRSNDDHRCFTR